MRRVYSILYAILSVLVCPLIGQAQTIEDGLRLSQQQSYYTPRAGGLGLAYRGISDDIAALYANPAGLGLIRFNELSLSLSMLRSASENTFLGISSVVKANSTSLNNIGFAVPIQSAKIKGGFALNYSRTNDFTNRFSFDAFNPSSSILPALTQAEGNFRDNLAYRLFLADTVNKVLFTPVKDSVQQSAFIREGGKVHSIATGFGLHLSPTISVGITVGTLWGDYLYLRDYNEDDVTNKYSSLDRVEFSTVDFLRLSLRDSLYQSFSGYVLRFGLLSRLNEWARCSFSITSPVSYTIQENFQRSASSRFDNGDVRSASESGSNSYSLHTPWTFSAGASVHSNGLTIAASIEYQDFSQMEFSNASSRLSELNQKIPFVLTEQVNWGIGAEYTPGLLPLTFRAGISYIGSAYTRATTLGTNTTVYSGGVGIFLADNVRLDGMMRLNQTQGTFSNYGDGSGSTYTLKNTPSVYALQLTYRY